MTKLFRDEVVQRRLSEIGVPLGITGAWIKLYAGVLAIALMAAAACVAFGSYTRKARVAGFLVPDKGLIKVLPTHEGSVSERRVEEGQRVVKDDVLFVIDVSAVTNSGRTGDLVTLNLKERRRLVRRELERLVFVQQAEAERLERAAF